MTEVVAALGGLIGLLLFAVKLLLGDWFSKQKQIEELKKKNSDAIQLKLDAELKALKIIVDDLNSMSKLLVHKLDRTDVRVDELFSRLTDAMKRIDEFKSVTTGYIREMIKKEFSEITKQIQLAKKAKSEGTKKD